MIDLFSQFDVNLGRQQGNATQPVHSTTQDRQLKELVELATAQQHLLAAAPQLVQKLNAIYRHDLVEFARKRGYFAFICARCRKPITDQSKLFHEEETGLVYGTDCYAKIQAKHTQLQTHYYPDGSRRRAEPDELETFKCPTLGKTFKALPENVKLCGSTVRCCAACPATGMKFKHVKCDFEKAIAARQQAAKDAI